MTADDRDLCYLSAGEAVSRFANGSLSPVDVLEAQIARSERVEPDVNAFTETYFDEALARAREAEKRYREGSQRPLEGLTLAVKDEFKLAGTRRTSSSLVYRDQVDDETDV